MGKGHLSLRNLFLGLDIHPLNMAITKSVQSKPPLWKCLAETQFHRNSDFQSRKSSHENLQGLAMKNPKMIPGFSWPDWCSMTHLGHDFYWTKTSKKRKTTMNFIGTTPNFGWWNSKYWMMVESLFITLVLSPWIPIHFMKLSCIFRAPPLYAPKYVFLSLTPAMLILGVFKGWTGEGINSC